MGITRFSKTPDLQEKDIVYVETGGEFKMNVSVEVNEAIIHMYQDLEKLGKLLWLWLLV